jgi:hypothetical protein
VSTHWCYIIVVLIIALFAATTYWSYTVPREYKDRHERWKRIWKT